MSFRFLPFLILFLCSSALGFSTNPSEVFSFVVQQGKQYQVTVVPEEGGDAVFGYASRKDAPFVVVNNFEEGRVESVRLITSSEELKVAVFSTKSAPRLSVIDEDQKFPFLRWKKKSTVEVRVGDVGKPNKYLFKEVSSENETFYADPIPGSVQKVKARSGIRYKYSLENAVPLDVLIIPETNHVNLSIHIKNGEEIKTINEDRNPGNIRQTGQGQVEWTQIYPKSKDVEIFVENKNAFAGEFRIVVRQLVGKARLRPVSWDYLPKEQLEETLESLLKTYPLINDDRGITFEILPKRNVSEYALEVTSIEPDVNFALVIRTDVNKPPVIVPAGGVRYRSAVFKWNLEGLSIFHPGREAEKLQGFPNYGKIRVFIAGFGGETRLRLKLKDRVTLDELPIPEMNPVVTESATAMLSNSYKGFGFARSGLNLYKFDVKAGEEYVIRVFPEPYFDAAIIDSSKRTYEDPTRLDLVDQKGVGNPEVLVIKPRGTETEFSVVGVRYRNGIIQKPNKLFGGTGFYRYTIKDRKGNSPKLIESRSVSLPNEFVQQKLGIGFQLWDPRPRKLASDLPPVITSFDPRIIDAVRNPRLAKINQP